MMAVHGPDTLYLWKAMKEFDADKFLEAKQQMIKEKKHWKLGKKMEGPEMSVLPSVCSMKHKRITATREVYI